MARAKKDLITQNTAVVLTVRTLSERFPGKALADVSGKPLIHWILLRLIQSGAKVILATTEDKSDDSVCEIASELEVDTYRGSTDDVVTRMDNAVKEYFPEALFVMRALGDCPFIEIDLIKRAVNVMVATEAEAFAWFLPPDTLNSLAYGSREFPYSRSGWQKIVDRARGNEREHVDLYFHRHRDKFKVVYHEPPDTPYFRPYRLEVDWPEDIELVRAVHEGLGMLSPLSRVCRWLDEHEEIARVNRERIEKTGLTISYNYSERRRWAKLMTGISLIAWDNNIWHPPTDKAKPIFCQSGQCLQGHGYKGILYTREGHQIGGNSWVSCRCGAGRMWNDPK